MIEVIEKMTAWWHDGACESSGSIGFPRGPPPTPFLILDEIRCRSVLLSMQGTARGFVHHEKGPASVNEAWLLPVMHDVSLASMGVFDAQVLIHGVSRYLFLICLEKNMINFEITTLTLLARSLRIDHHQVPTS